MSKESVRKAHSSPGELDPDNSLAVWLRLQKSLAEKSGVALTTLSRDGAVIGRIENDNSICRAMRVSPDHSPLCAADCGAAYSNAIDADGQFDFTCHAGLHCFAIPVDIDQKQLVILGGRSYASTAEYTEFLRQYGEMSAVESGDCLKSIKFIEARELAEAADLVGSTASYHFQHARKAEPPSSADRLEPTNLADAQLEIVRLTDQLETRRRSITQFYEFLRGISSTLDSQKVYHSLLEKFSEMMKAERSSLMILNQESNELALEAAVGVDPEASGPVRIKLGDAIAGAVLASGSPLVVRGILPLPPR